MFPWEKKSIKITSLNKLNHLTLRVQVRVAPRGPQSKRERGGQHESGKTDNFSTFLQFQCSLLQDQLRLLVRMKLRERGKDMVSAKKKVRRRFESHDKNWFGKRLRHLSVAQRTKGCQMI